jgi:LuxR family transcriptional regulator, regulator of acetate metabolism
VVAGAASDQLLAGRVVKELRRLERELIELALVRRSDALDRVGDAIRRLGELGTPQGILDRAPQELGRTSGFDRVVVSEVREGSMMPVAIWSVAGDDARAGWLLELQKTPVALEYPLVEQEAVVRQRTELVDVIRAGQRTPPRFRDVLGWRSYVTAPLIVDGTTVGLLHADAHRSGRRLDQVDCEVTARYAEGFAGAFERAVLRETLMRHRGELESAVQWLSGRVSRLDLDAPAGSPAGAAGGADPGAGTIDALTRRELDVLRLLARGQTNAAIARALVIREGTVKYHVKNILRKLGATSRADAVARFARASGPARRT